MSDSSDLVDWLRLTDRLGEDDPYAWLVAEHLLTERGGELDFESHPFLLGPLRDPAREIVVRKAAQLGFTLVFTFKTLHRVIRGLNWIYTYPTDGLLQAKVAEVVDGLLRHNPGLARLVGAENSLHAKRVGRGWLWFVATETERAGIARPADGLSHDEYDRGNITNAAVFDSRLAHSEHRYKWCFSNPTVPGVEAAPTRNIDGLWQISDQKHWFVRCPKGCGSHDGWQYLDWPESVDTKRAVFQCRHCGRELDRRRGMWWPKYPGRPVSGYWLSQLAAPWLDAAHIIAESQKDPEYFHNFVLGQPYLGGLELPWETVIDRALAGPTKDRADVVFGVDQGQAMGQWVVIGSARQGILSACNVPRWEDVDALAALWQPRAAVIDVDPEREAVRKLTERLGKLGCRVVAVDYIDAPRRGKDLDYLDDKAEPVQAFRTQTIDAFALGPFAQGTYPIRLGADELATFRTHWRTMTPRYEPDPRGNPVRRWVSSGPDHLAHATIYWWLALTRFAAQPATVRLPEEDY